MPITDKVLRPLDFSLRRARLPVAAWTSLGHRLSGILLALAVPGLLYLLELSLRDEHGYARVLALLDYPQAQIVSGVLLWAILHHALAGIRFLCMDMDLGVGARSARVSAWIVNAASVTLAIILTVLQ